MDPAQRLATLPRSREFGIVELLRRRAREMCAGAGPRLAGPQGAGLPYEFVHVGGDRRVARVQERRDSRSQSPRDGGHEGIRVHGGGGYQREDVAPHFVRRGRRASGHLRFSGHGSPPLPLHERDCRAY